MASFESMKLPPEDGYGAPMEPVLNGNDLPLNWPSSPATEASYMPASSTQNPSPTLDSIPPSNGYLPSSSPSSNSAFPHAASNGFSNANPDEQAGEIDNLPIINEELPNYGSNYGSNPDEIPGEIDNLSHYSNRFSPPINVNVQVNHHVSKIPQRPSHYYSAVTQNLPRYKKRKPGPKKEALRSYKQRIGASYLPTPNELVEQSESYRPIFREQFTFPKGPQHIRARRRNGVPGYLALLADLF